MKKFIFKLRGTEIEVSVTAVSSLKAWSQLSLITNNASFARFDLQEELETEK